MSTRVQPQNKLSFVPIEIERTLSGARHTENDNDTTAEDLLNRLISAPLIVPHIGPSLRRKTKRLPKTTYINDEESLNDRVRRLAGSMSAAKRRLAGDLPQRMATITLLIQIAQAHDPEQPGITPQNALWQYWVRAEVARVLASAPRTRAITESRQIVKRLLNTKTLPLEIRHTAHTVRKRSFHEKTFRSSRIF